MFKRILSFVAIAATAANFVACSEDAEPAASDNYFTVNEDTFPLLTGTIASIQTEHHPVTNEVVDEWDIFLSSGDLDGKTHWVRFILNSSDENTVPLGTYTYDEEYKDHQMDDFTFYVANIMRNADLEEGSGDLFANTDFSSGTVTIAKSGNVYTVTYSIVLDGGATSTGHYTGLLTAQ